MRARRNATPIPRATDLVPGNSISRAQAVALIASRVRKRHDDDRTARDRARKRIDSHIENGKLQADSTGKILVNELGRWAIELWPDKFRDLPRSYVLHAEPGAYSLHGHDAALRTGSAKPSNVEACHEIIAALDAKIWQLESDLDAARNQIRTLRHDAEKQRERKAKASAAGKLGGRGNTRG